MIVKCKVELYGVETKGTIIIPMEYETLNQNPIDTFDIASDIEEDVRYALNTDAWCRIKVHVEKGDSVEWNQ